MSYIGTPPSNAFTSLLKQDFSTSATTGYTLDHAVNNANDIALFINFVRQEPTAGYAASGTTLTLTSATASSDDMYCVYLGQALQTVNPANASVGSDQTAPTIITGQTAETSIATDDTILIHDTSASALRKMTRANFVSGIGGVNTPAFQARLSNEPAIATGTWTKVPFNTESYDVGGCYDNSSNYRFTPTTAGKYVFFVQVGINAIADGKYMYASVYKNGSTLWGSANAINYAGATGGFASRYTITAEANGSSDYFEGYAYHNHGSSRDFTAGWSFFGGYKLIE